MIIELLLNIFIGFIKVIFVFINLPNLPQELLDSITGYLSLVYSNLSFFGFFVRPFTLLLAFDVVVAVWIFVRLYKLTMWIVRKLPFSIE